MFSGDFGRFGAGEGVFNTQCNAAQTQRAAGPANNKQSAENKADLGTNHCRYKAVLDDVESPIRLHLVNKVMMMFSVAVGKESRPG